MAEPKIAKVVGKKRWTEILHSIYIKADFVTFEPGQFGRIGLKVDDKIIMRPYSFVNSPTELRHEFYYAVVPEGPLSSRLSTLNSGDDIYIADKPNGYLVLSEVPDAKQLWMLCTGTAVGPFLSILKNPKVWQRFEQLVLVHAVRHTADLSYGDEIQNLVESSNGRLRFVPFVSRESYLDALSGRIPTALESGILQSRTGLDISPTDTQFMICGNPQMVKDTSTTLQQMGFERNRRRNPGHITVENYW